MQHSIDPGGASLIAAELRPAPDPRRGGAARTARRLAGVVAGLLAFAVGAAPGGSAELLMFEQRACPFCEAFNREIAPDYPRSEAGLVAPLRHVDIWESRTGGIAGLDPAVFTPTFVLVDGGKEIGRMLGYPGRRYFYPELGKLISQLPRPAVAEGRPPARPEGEP